MRTCPHCKFLVSDGATTCSVCQAALPAPVPVAAFVAPGETTAAPSAPSPQFGAAVPPPLPGSLMPGSLMSGPLGPGSPAAPVPTPANKGASTKKVLAIVGALCLVPLLVIGGLVAVISLLGTTSGELSADGLYWTPYEHPDGIYSVDMPGVVDSGTVDAPVQGYGSPMELESVWVTDRDFVVTVARTPDAVMAGQNFDNLPTSSAAMERAGEQLGIEGAELVSNEKVEGSEGSAMAAEMRGTVDGEDSIFLTRIVIAGTDFYELNVIGAAANEAELRSIHERLTSSFEPAV